MSKRPRIILPGWLWLLLLLVGAWWLLRITQVIPPLGELFRQQPVTIDETPLVITGIKGIAQLNTTALYHEMVIDSTIPSVLPVNALKKRIVLIARGTAVAGTDLNKLKEEDVYISGDSITLKLPAAEITSLQLNPSAFETFYENGRWSGDEVNAVKQKAEQELKREAIRQNLLHRANEHAARTIELLLRNSGFKVVKVTAGT